MNHRAEIERILSDVNPFDHEEQRDLRRIIELLEQIVGFLKPAHSATASSIIITGDPMQATQHFTDANGLVAAAPAGLVEAWSSSDPTVATVDSTSGFVIELADGVTDITVANSGAFLPDGVTPFPDPAGFSLTVAAGAAVASTIEVA